MSEGNPNGVPTPDYVIETWNAMHKNMCSETMLAWEQACQRARNEAQGWKP